MWKALFIITIALLAVSTNDAQSDIDTSAPLTLDQCIEIALEQSPSVRIAILNSTAARFNVDDARAKYLPEIGVSGQYRFSDDIDFGWERQNYDAQIDASYTIWDHGRRKAGLAQAKANQIAVQNDHDKTEQDLIYSITTAYYGLLEAKKMIDVYEKLLEISSGNVEKVIFLVEKIESAIPADVATARVQQANDELALVNAKNNLELARANLAARMGLDPRTPVQIVDVEETPARLEMNKTPLEKFIAKAIKNRPELSRLHARLISLEWSLKQAQLDRWPIISAEYGYNVHLADYLRDRGDFKKYSDWNAIARVSFPIFDGGVSKRREQNAEIAVQQMKEDMNERERAIMLEVQQAYLSLERAGKSLDIAEKQVEDATLSLNATQKRYELGMVILLEVLSAQAQYAQVLTNQVKAFYDYKIAEKALLKAMGALKVED